MRWFLYILAAIVAVVVFCVVLNRIKRYLRTKELHMLKGLQSRHFFVKFKNLPFEPDLKQVIYVESEYNEEINLFIQHNYKKIYKHFKSRGYEFCYLPMLASNFSEEEIAYYMPTRDNKSALSILSSLLLDFMAKPQNRKEIKPSLLYINDLYTAEDVTEEIFCGFELDNIESLNRRLGLALKFIIEDQKNSFDELYDIFHDSKIGEKEVEAPSQTNPEQTSQQLEISSHPLKAPFSEETILQPTNPQRSTVNGESVSYSLNLDDFFKQPERYDADGLFDTESKDLLYDVIEKVECLIKSGISKYALQKLLFGPAKLSRMVITHDYRILLPDYDNREIMMTPLVKAVYILFLCHPEGIVFKCLPDYRNELMCIYMTIFGVEEPTEPMIKSVLAVTDPYNNSINEKCARIREAFISQFDEDLAKNYFITGKRGEPKGISLPRDIVEWEELDE